MSANLTVWSVVDLRLRISSKALGRELVLEFEGKQASALLSLLAAALGGTIEELTVARICFEMRRQPHYGAVAQALGLSKKTVWDYRRRFNIPDLERPQLYLFQEDGTSFGGARG